MAFTNSRVEFRNGQTMMEQEIAQAFSFGQNENVTQGLDIQANKITAGAFFNGGFSQLGNPGETETLPDNYSGYITIKTTFNGSASKSELIYTDERMANDRLVETAPDVKYFTIYRMINGQVIDDYRNLILWETIQNYNPVLDSMNDEIESIRDQLSEIIIGDGDPSVLSLENAGYNDDLYGEGTPPSPIYEKNSETQEYLPGQNLTVETYVTTASMVADTRTRSIGGYSRAVNGVVAGQEVTSGIRYHDLGTGIANSDGTSSETEIRFGFTNNNLGNAKVIVNFSTFNGEEYEDEILSSIYDETDAFFEVEGYEGGENLNIFFPNGKDAFAYFQNKFDTTKIEKMEIKITGMLMSSAINDNNVGDEVLKCHFINFINTISTNHSYNILKGEGAVKPTFDKIMYNWHKNLIKSKFDVIDTLDRFPNLESSAKDRFKFIGSIMIDIRMSSNFEGQIILTELRSSKQITIVTKNNVGDVVKNGDYFVYDTSVNRSFESIDIVNLFTVSELQTQERTFDALYMMVLLKIYEVYGFDAQGHVRIWISNLAFSSTDTYQDKIRKYFGKYLKYSVDKTGIANRVSGPTTGECVWEFDLPVSHAYPVHMDILMNNNANVYRNVGDNYNFKNPNTGLAPGDNFERFSELTKILWDNKNSTGYTVRKAIYK